MLCVVPVDAVVLCIVPVEAVVLCVVPVDVERSEVTINEALLLTVVRSPAVALIVVENLDIQIREKKQKKEGEKSERRRKEERKEES